MHITSHKDVCIWIENGGELKVNNGTIQNGVIAPEPGGSLRITNGGQIIHSREDYFEVPIGASFYFQRGEIKYRDN